MKLFKRKSAATANCLLLYATARGNARSVAELAEQYYKKQGIRPKCRSIGKASVADLAEVKQLLVVISTDGNGTPPPMAHNFFEELEDDEAPKLSHLTYAICALGDSSYTWFCEAGKRLDKRLQALNAKAIVSRVDCDADYSDRAIGWIKETAGHLKVVR